MSEETYINFTYKSVNEDFKNSIGYNPDSSINITYTLMTIRNLLLNNVKIIDRLLEYNKSIKEMVPINNSIKISFFSEEIKKILQEEGTINYIPLHINENNEFRIFDNEEIPETNYDRLSMIHNLTRVDNLSDLDTILNSDGIIYSTSESEVDELIYDKENINNLVNKYQNLISDEYSDKSDDTDRYSNSEYSESSD